MITKLLMLFLASAVLSLLLTPFVRRVGERLGIVDKPSQRKIHTRPVARIGGVAIYLSFYLPFFVVLSWLYGYDSGHLFQGVSFYGLLVGSHLVFLVGLIDDVHSLNPRTKFAVQIAAVLVAYAGGLQITQVVFPGGFVWSLGWLSLPATVFWFLLVINSVNLIDGMDGLAVGVSLFASLVLLGISWMNGYIAVTLTLALLAGACLGFLRYNFNPASIFMGDSGSYFLGYMLAAFGIMGATTSQTGVTILVPVVVLGVPLFDTLLAPVRRFVLGNRLFYPDKSHIHHKLLQMGLTQRRAVLMIYAATVLLGSFALILVKMDDGFAPFVLIALAAAVYFVIRKLGYVNYVCMPRIKSYFLEVADAAGLNKSRRRLLAQQIAISQSRDLPELWAQLDKTFHILKIDFAEISLSPFLVMRLRANNIKNGNGGNGPARWTPEGTNVNSDFYFLWNSGKPDSVGVSKERMLRVRIPLTHEGKVYGNMILTKDVAVGSIPHFTLKYIECLRRSIILRLKDFEAGVLTVGDSVPPKSSKGSNVVRPEHCNGIFDSLSDEQVIRVMSK